MRGGVTATMTMTTMTTMKLHTSIQLRLSMVCEHRTGERSFPKWIHFHRKAKVGVVAALEQHALSSALPVSWGHTKHHRFYCDAPNGKTESVRVRAALQSAQVKLPRRLRRTTTGCRPVAAPHFRALARLLVISSSELVCKKRKTRGSRGVGPPS